MHPDVMECSPPNTRGKSFWFSRLSFILAIWFMASFIFFFIGNGLMVFIGSAVGTVKLMDLAVESEYDIRRQGTLMVAKYAMGHGVLRPEAAVGIKEA